MDMVDTIPKIGVYIYITYKVRGTMLWNLLTVAGKICITGPTRSRAHLSLSSKLFALPTPRNNDGRSIDTKRSAARRGKRFDFSQVCRGESCLQHDSSDLGKVHFDFHVFFQIYKIGITRVPLSMDPRMKGGNGYNKHSIDVSDSY